MARVVTSHHGQIVNVPEHTAAMLFPDRPGPGTDRQPASRRARKFVFGGAQDRRQVQEGPDGRLRACPLKTESSRRVSAAMSAAVSTACPMRGLCRNGSHIGQGALSPSLWCSAPRAVAGLVYAVR